MSIEQISLVYGYENKEQIELTCTDLVAVLAERIKEIQKKAPKGMDLKDYLEMRIKQAQRIQEAASLLEIRYEEQLEEFLNKK